MNFASAVVIAIIVVAAAFALTHLLRHPEKRSCGGDCSGCALKDGCRDKESTIRR